MKVQTKPEYAKEKCNQLFDLLYQMDEIQTSTKESYEYVMKSIKETRELIKMLYELTTFENEKSRKEETNS